MNHSRFFFGSAFLPARLRSFLVVHARRLKLIFGERRLADRLSDVVRDVQPERFAVCDDMPLEREEIVPVNVDLERMDLWLARPDARFHGFRVFHGLSSVYQTNPRVKRIAFDIRQSR